MDFLLYENGYDEVIVKVVGAIRPNKLWSSDGSPLVISRTAGNQTNVVVSGVSLDGGAEPVTAVRATALASTVSVSFSNDIDGTAATTSLLEDLYQKKNWWMGARILSRRIAGITISTIPAILTTSAAARAAGLPDYYEALVVVFQIEKRTDGTYWAYGKWTFGLNNNFLVGFDLSVAIDRADNGFTTNLDGDYYPGDSLGSALIGGLLVDLGSIPSSPTSTTATTEFYDVASFPVVSFTGGTGTFGVEGVFSRALGSDAALSKPTIVIRPIGGSWGGTPLGPRIPGLFSDVTHYDISPELFYDGLQGNVGSNLGSFFAPSQNWVTTSATSAVFVNNEPVSTFPDTDMLFNNNLGGTWSGYGRDIPGSFAGERLDLNWALDLFWGADVTFHRYYWRNVNGNFSSEDPAVIVDSENITSFNYVVNKFEHISVSRVRKRFYFEDGVFKSTTLSLNGTFDSAWDDPESTLQTNEITYGAADISPADHWNILRPEIKIPTIAVSPTVYFPAHGELLSYTAQVTDPHNTGSEAYDVAPNFDAITLPSNYGLPDMGEDLFAAEGSPYQETLEGPRSLAWADSLGIGAVTDTKPWPVGNAGVLATPVNTTVVAMHRSKVATIERLDRTSFSSLNVEKVYYDGELLKTALVNNTTKDAYRVVSTAGFDDQYATRLVERTTERRVWGGTYASTPWSSNGDLDDSQVYERFTRTESLHINGHIVAGAGGRTTFTGRVIGYHDIPEPIKGVAMLFWPKANGTDDGILVVDFPDEALWAIAKAAWELAVDDHANGLIDDATLASFRSSFEATRTVLVNNFAGDTLINAMEPSTSKLLLA
jgi:hypothetical protein